MFAGFWGEIKSANFINTCAANCFIKTRKHAVGAKFVGKRLGIEFFNAFAVEFTLDIDQQEVAVLGIALHWLQRRKAGAKRIDLFVTTPQCSKRPTSALPMTRRVPREWVRRSIA